MLILEAQVAETPMQAKLDRLDGDRLIFVRPSKSAIGGGVMVSFGRWTGGQIDFDGSDGPSHESLTEAFGELLHVVELVRLLARFAGDVVVRALATRGISARCELHDPPNRSTGAVAQVIVQRPGYGTAAYERTFREAQIDLDSATLTYGLIAEIVQGEAKFARRQEQNAARRAKRR